MHTHTHLTVFILRTRTRTVIFALHETLTTHWIMTAIVDFATQEVRTALQRSKAVAVESRLRHRGGRHGKEELVFRPVAIVLQSGSAWAAEVSGVLRCRRLDQRQSRCVSSPPPLRSPGRARVFAHDLSAPLFLTAHNS